MAAALIESPRSQSDSLKLWSRILTGIGAVASLITISLAFFEYPLLFYVFLVASAVLVVSAAFATVARLTVRAVTEEVRKSVENTVQEKYNETLHDINVAVAPGYFERVGVEAILRSEERADRVMVITDDFKFEKLTDDDVTSGSRFRKLVVQNWQKYSYLLPDHFFEEGKKFLAETLSRGGFRPDLVDYFLQSSVQKVEKRYFDLLRPFPERTYVFSNGDSTVCDFFRLKHSDTIIFYQTVEGDDEDRQKAKEFQEAFSAYFKNRQ